MRYVLIVLATFFAPFSALAAILYAFDPLQLFHKPWGREPAFSNQMQFQAAGLLRTYDYDGLILGTSMLENTSAEEAGRLLGGRFLNVSLSGSAAFERSYLLRFALRAGRVTHVIFSLEWGAFRPYRDRKDRPIAEWTFLYEEPFPLRVCFNPKYWACIPDWELVGCAKEFQRVDPENLVKWENKQIHARRFGGFANWVKYQEDDQQIQKVFDSVLKDWRAEKKPLDFDRARQQFNLMRVSFDEIILQPAAHNPDVRFSLIIPPYFRYLHAYWLQDDANNFVIFEMWLRYLAKIDDMYDNISIHGFDDLDYSDKIENYKDLHHYAPDMNSYMLRSIQTGSHRVTPDTVEDYIASVRRRAKAFEIGAFRQQIAKAVADQELASAVESSTARKRKKQRGEGRARRQKGVTR